MDRQVNVLDSNLDNSEARHAAADTSQAACVHPLFLTALIDGSISTRAMTSMPICRGPTSFGSRHGGRWTSIPDIPVGRIFIVNDDHHPDADLSLISHEWCAVDPFVLALLVAPADPPNFGGHAPTLGKSGRQFFAHTIGTSDLLHERRL